MLLNLPIIIGASLADSINPAVFTLLIVTLSSLSKPSKLLPQAAAFIFGFFTTSLLAGLFLLPIIFIFSSISTYFYPLLGLAIALMGSIELFIHIKPNHKLSKHTIFSHHHRAQAYSHRLPSSALALGLLVSLVELPLSGGIYLATLSLINLDSPTIAVFPTLLLYNIILIIPLIIIALTAHFGLSTSQFKLQQQNRYPQLHLGLGALLVILGFWLIANP